MPWIMGPRASGSAVLSLVDSHWADDRSNDIKRATARGMTPKEYMSGNLLKSAGSPYLMLCPRDWRMEGECSDAIDGGDGDATTSGQ